MRWQKPPPLVVPEPELRLEQLFVPEQLLWRQENNINYSDYSNAPHTIGSYLRLEPSLVRAVFLLLHLLKESELRSHK